MKILEELIRVDYWKNIIGIFQVDRGRDCPSDRIALETLSNLGGGEQTHREI